MKRSCGSRRWRSWQASICRSPPYASRSAAGSRSSSSSSACPTDGGASRTSSRSSPTRAIHTSCGPSCDRRDPRARRDGVVRGDVRRWRVEPAPRARDPAARVAASLARLERIAALLRSRLALAAERAALLAQSQASALVLVALAPLGVVFFSLAMDGYFATLFDAGRIVLVLALAFECAGAAWLWRIVRSTLAPADLASFLDAMVVGLEAGLTFERALAGLVERASLTTRDADARRLLADLALGRPLRDALATFARGPDEARITSLVVASMRFGSPLARLLVLQAGSIRTTGRHRAEAPARRLPLLMLFPLTFCILPALLLVFLGPPLLTLIG